MKKEIRHGNGSLILLIGDITTMRVDAIVNAANARLILGGGVAGAIASKGGPAIQDECSRIGGTFVGGAVITTAGKLPAKKVIHAVGPRMGEGNEDEKLRNATRNSLKVARDNQLSSIAFPAISTGIFGFPVDRCADIMLAESLQFLKSENQPNEIYFCLWEESVYKTFAEKLDILLED